MIKRLLFVSAVLFSTILNAQGDGQDSNIYLHTNEGRWYASPWVWIAGAAVFILLLVMFTKEKKDGER